MLRSTGRAACALAIFALGAALSPLRDVARAQDRPGKDATATGDATSPLVEVLKPAPNQVLGGSTKIHVVAKVTDNSGKLKQVTINGQAVSPRHQDGLYVLPIDIKEGANKISVQAWDPSENSAHVAFTVRYQKPPELSGSYEIVFRGKVDDPKAKVTVNGKAVSVNEDGSFETRVTPDANGKITVVALDEFGNESRQVHDIRGK